MRRAIWLVAVIAASIVVSAAGVWTPAHACSCADRLPVRDEVGAARMSFIGTVASTEPNADGTTTYLVDVDEAISGQVPATVAVVSANDEAACGGPVPVGVPSGFVPIWFDDRWNVSICGGLVSASELRALADERLPAPTGSGPVAGLVLARAGPAQAIAVDASGRPLGYVVLDPPDDRARFVSYGDGCPGGATAVLGIAIADGSNLYEVAVVDLASLRVVSWHQVTGDYLGDWPGLERFDCVSADGDVMTFTSRAATRSDPRLTVVRDGTAALLEPADIDVGAVTAAAGAGTDIAVAIGGLIVLVSPDAAHPAQALVDVGADVVALDMSGDRMVAATGTDGRAARLVGYTPDGAETSAVDLPEPLSMVRLWTSDTLTVLRSYDDGRGVAVHADGTLETLGNGAALLGSTLLTWSYDAPITVRSDAADALSWVSPSGLRSVAMVDAGVMVDGSAAGATALPAVAEPGRIVPAPAETRDTTVPSATSVGTSVTSADPEADDDDDDGGVPAGPVLLAIVVAGAAVAGALVVRRRRRAAARGQ